MIVAAACRLWPLLANTTVLLRFAKGGDTASRNNGRTCATQFPHYNDFGMAPKLPAIPSSFVLCVPALLQELTTL